MSETLSDLEQATQAWATMDFSPMPASVLALVIDPSIQSLQVSDRTDTLQIPRDILQPTAYDLASTLDAYNLVKNKWSLDPYVAVPFRKLLGPTGHRLGSHILGELVPLSTEIHAATTAIIAGSVLTDQDDPKCQFAYWDNGTTYSDTKVMQIAISSNQPGGLKDTSGALRHAVIGEAILRNTIFNCLAGTLSFASGEHRLEIQLGDEDLDIPYYFLHSSGPSIIGNAVVIEFPLVTQPVA